MCSYHNIIFQNSLLVTYYLHWPCWLFVCLVKRRFERDLRRIWKRAGLKKAPVGWTTPKIFIKQHGNKQKWVFVAVCTLQLKQWQHFLFVYNYFGQCVHNLINILSWLMRDVLFIFAGLILCRWLIVSSSVCWWQYCVKKKDAPTCNNHFFLSAWLCWRKRACTCGTKARWFYR